MTELILSGSPGLMSLHVLDNGSDAVQWKSSGSASAVTYVGPRRGYGGLLAVLCGRQLFYYGFTKEAPLGVKSILPSKITCTTLSNSGDWLVAGTQSGQIMIWQTATGLLLRAFDGHLQAVTCLQWTTDDAALVSGSNDASIHVWHILDLVKFQTDQSQQIEPAMTLRAHTSAITHVSLATAIFPDVQVVSASDDGSCRIWDLSRQQDPLLGSLTFGSNTKVKLVAFDPLRRFFYASLQVASTAKTTHTVVKVDLYRCGSADSSLLESAMDSRAGALTKLDPLKQPNSYVSPDQVTAIHLSTLSPHLLVGTVASQIVILELPSLQAVRSFSPTKALSVPLPNPIIFLSTMLRPPDLVPKAGLQPGAEDKTLLLPRPVRELSTKAADPAGLPDESTTQRIEPQPSAGDLLDLPSVFGKSFERTQLPPAPLSAGPPSSGEYVSMAEHAKMAATLKHTVDINQRLWQIIVDKGLSSRSQKPSEVDRLLDLQ